MKNQPDSKHENNTKYVCKICTLTFIKKSNLNRHFQNVHKKSKYQCSKCTMVFTDESNKNRHSKKCKITFPCLKCRFIYITQDDLLYHCYLNHDGPKCSKTFLKNRINYE